MWRCQPHEANEVAVEKTEDDEVVGESRVTIRETDMRLERESNRQRKREKQARDKQVQVVDCNSVTHQHIIQLTREKDKRAQHAL